MAGDPVIVSVAQIIHCALYLLYVSVLSKKREELNVLMAFMVSVIVTALANAILVYRLNKYGINKESMYNYVILKYVRDAVVLSAIGNTCIFIGYEVFKKKSLPPITVMVTNPKTLDIIFRIAVVLAVANFAGYVVNFGKISGGFQKFVTLFYDMSVLFFARLWGKEESKKYRTYAIILCIFRVLIALFTAYLRIELLQPFIIFFGGYFLGKGRMKYVLSFRIVPALVVMVSFSLVFATLGANRAQFAKVFFKDEDAEQVVTVMERSYAITSEQESDRNNVLIRGANIAQLSNIFSLVERNGFYNGKISLPLIAAFIPRFLWPEKPSFELGTWFALEIGVATVNPLTNRANNSVNMSIPGQLYMDFGYPGVIIGCFFVGLILASFWNAAQFNASPNNIFGTIWGGYLLFFSLFGIGADLQIFVTLTSTYIAFLLIKRLIGLYANTEHRPAMER